MTKEQLNVQTWMRAFGQETPTKPIIPSLEVRKLRAKLILEEALETIAALGMHVSIKDTYTGQHWIYDACFDEVSIEAINPDFVPSLELILDGCEDLKVVTEGTLVACGLLDPEKGFDNAGCYKGEDPYFTTVIDSNWSKFWSDTEKAQEQAKTTQWLQFAPAAPGKWIAKDSQGKVIKSPSFRQPNFQL